MKYFNNLRIKMTRFKVQDLKLDFSYNLRINKVIYTLLNGNK